MTLVRDDCETDAGDEVASRRLRRAAEGVIGVPATEGNRVEDDALVMPSGSQPDTFLRALR